MPRHRRHGRRRRQHRLSDAYRFAVGTDAAGLIGHQCVVEIALLPMLRAAALTLITIAVLDFSFDYRHWLSDFLRGDILPL